MAGSGYEEFKDLISTAYNRATSHPIGRIEKTLTTSRAASRGGRSLSEDLQPASELLQRASEYIRGPRKRVVSKTKFRRYGPAAPKKRARAKSAAKGRK